ncbi:MAG TPA: uroporphyrinogen-III C-methyltransferase [Armatimonadota bacterium]|jgi:uroporphyrinogen III methyltransferase/synthase
MTEATGAAPGIVYLVGAGPGDPGLITVHGLVCLREAEVVVYDRLVSEELLAEAAPGAELIYCGKQPAHHELAQEEINHLLVTKAQEGRSVCRLKGGDPFVFGRGGEELLALVAAGVPFEVVPGVTSAVAAPAYAGIPVTHRGVAASVAIVTGHEDPDKGAPQVNWAHLATSVDTLVILMGRGHLTEIVDRLIAGGRDALTPAAAVSWGTCPQQQTVESTLYELPAAVASAGLTNPAVVVIGEVVALRERLAWFDTRPLSGRRVLVTRTREQASDLSRLLRRAGAIPVEMPVIALAPPESWGGFDAALAEISAYDWLVFTSVNGVRCTRQRLEELGQDVRALAGPWIAAMGAATAAEVERAGLRVALQPEEYRAEALAEALREQGLAGTRLLVLRASEGREVLVEAAREAGAEVTVAPVYCTVPRAELEPAVREQLLRGELDAITFASSSSVRAFVAAAGGAFAAQSLLAGVTVACLGPITAETAREHGLTVAVMPHEYTIERLVQALADHFAASAGQREE